MQEIYIFLSQQNRKFRILTKIESSESLISYQLVFSRMLSYGNMFTNFVIFQDTVIVHDSAEYHGAVTKSEYVHTHLLK